MSAVLAEAIIKSLDPAFPVEWRPNTEGELRAFYMDPKTQREYEAAWCPQAG